MFTGLVDDVGTVTSVSESDAGLELRLSCGYADLQPGESIALNGACLTVRECGDGWFTVAAVITTLGRTTVAEWKSGRRVNLERAMRADGRLGGHIVQGHVDGVGIVDDVERAGDALLLNLALPPGLAETVVPHGSVTIDGVSLTVNDIRGDRLQLSLIDYTLHHTTLGGLGAGSRVHVETDVIGKYVRRIIAPHLNQ
ncbi:MAG: riboflavin synthase [Gemmatimonadaceae bacterium]|nr:riboflavin synthase [Gemmatimonadaceae bacterium]